MRLVWSTEEFEHAGRSRPGFPILLGDDLAPIQPFQDFLLWKLIEEGTRLKPLTWDAYGRRLWDYVCYLDRNKVAWNAPFEAPGFSPMAQYRDWSCGELSLEDSTVRGRLLVVREFYEWAKQRSLINKLPFAYVDARVGGRNQNYTGQSVNLQPLSWEKDALFLTFNEIRLVRELIHSPTRMLLFQLLLRVGLRSCEARTFPLKYVFDPSKRPELSPAQLIPVQLDPRDMEIKYSKRRVVDVPYSLMAEMHQYTCFERNRLAGCISKERSLLLTVFGTGFSKSAVVGVFNDLSKRVGFRVTALMLRHSYAIHTLMRLRGNPTYVGEPLLYVRDRLGHERVETTMKYLEQIERLAGAIVAAANDEFDQLFRP